jgi:HTH-type transcriptional regulator/antitoxin HigA
MVWNLPKWESMTPQTTFDLKALEHTWTAFDRIAHLRPVRNEDEYDRTVMLMNYLLDVVGDQEDHPLAGLLDLVSELVEDFDTEHYVIK